MFKNLVFILNYILIAISILSKLLGWHDKVNLVMAIGYIIAAFACIRFLTIRNKKRKIWDVRLVIVWLLIDIAGFICYCGICQ